MRSFNEELLLVSKFISEAEEALSRGDDISIRLGVITIDLAAETLLKVVAGKLGASINQDSKFRELQKGVIEAAKNIGKEVSYINKLNPLRHLRNTVQHDGTSPNPGAARKLEADAKDVLKQLSLDVFAEDVTNLSLESFVKSADLSGPLQSARNHINIGKCAEAVEFCKGAFDSLMRRWTAYFQSLWGLREGPEDLFANITSSLSAGIYLPDLKKFREITKDAGFGGKSSDEQIRAARFCLEFVAGWAIRIEGRLDSK